jgi:hypothetical protein
MIMPIIMLLPQRHGIEQGLEKAGCFPLKIYNGYFIIILPRYC